MVKILQVFIQIVEVRASLREDEAPHFRNYRVQRNHNESIMSHMRYFLYARKSTDTEDKQVLSIEAQLVELRALARRDGLDIVEEFVEKRSAKTPGRSVFEGMMRRVEHGEASGIICWKIGRQKVSGTF